MGSLQVWIKRKGGNWKEDDRREKLMKPGPEKLADALLELAYRSDEAEVLINRLASSQKEIIKRFKAQLPGLKRSRRFVESRDARQLAKNSRIC